MKNNRVQCSEHFIDPPFFDLVRILLFSAYGNGANIGLWPVREMSLAAMLFLYES